jgi:dTMP kinase
MNPVAQRGLLITFEGSEGCGKSTQVARLAARLRGLGFGVRELREPGGTALGEEIRHTLKHSPAGSGMTPEAELLLFNAARAQLVREVIRPALAAGEILLCDRFLDSTLAYQGWGRGLDRKLVETVLDITVGPTLPDLTLLLRVAPADAPPGKGRGGTGGRGPLRSRKPRLFRACGSRIRRSGVGKPPQDARHRCRRDDRRGCRASLAGVATAYRGTT